MFFSYDIMLKQCAVFLKVTSMAKQVMLFDSHNMALKTFWLAIANKKPLFTKPTIAQIEIS